MLLAGGTQSSGFEVQLAAAYVGLNDWAQARTHAAAAVRLATTPEETDVYKRQQFMCGSVGVAHCAVLRCEVTAGLLIRK